jgi:hypothetical protein
MIRRMGLVLAVFTAVAIAFGPAAPAHADAPVITTQTFVRSGDLLDGASCPGSTAHVLFTSEISIRYWRLYDDAGALLLERRHVSFTGTLTGTATGRTAPYQGHFTRTFDFRTGELTFTGLRFQTVGSGSTSLDAGRVVVIEPSGEVIFSAGQHNYGDEVCVLLNG